MTIAMIGSGDARDHATFARLGKDGDDPYYLLLGANGLLARLPGVERVADIEAAVARVNDLGADVVLVQRPELLLAGLVDRVRADGHLVVGPDAAAAELEGSKLLAKDLMARAAIPTPHWSTHRTLEEAQAGLEQRWDAGRRPVVKSERYLSDAALRTVLPATLEEGHAAVEALFALPEYVHGGVLLEDRVVGPEISVHVLLDGSGSVTCPLVCDYKTLLDGDKGPNTHGMGAVATTIGPPGLAEVLDDMIVAPTVAALQQEGRTFRGVLYIGVVLTDGGPCVLEFNVRPGNPEWVAALPLLSTPLPDLVRALATDDLVGADARWRPGASVVVHAVGPGYPAEMVPYAEPVRGLTTLPPGVDAFGEGIEDAGGDEGLVAGAGRSFCLAAVASSVTDARDLVYSTLGTAGFAGMCHRTDIGLGRPLSEPEGARSGVAERRRGRDARQLRRWSEDDDRERARQRVSELTASLIDATGRGVDLDDADLGGLDLSGFDLRRASLNRTQLHGTNLSRCDLTGASLICTGTERTSFREAVLRGAYIHAFAAQVCDFRDADLSGLSDATGALFHGCDMRGVTLDGAMLASASIYQCRLDRASLRGANLTGSLVHESTAVATSFVEAALGATTFLRVDMMDADLSRTAGATVSMLHLLGADGIRLDGARLPGLRLVGLRGQSWSAVDVHASEVEVRDVSLSGATFVRAEMGGSSWTRAHLVDAVFEGAQADASRWLNCVMDGIRAPGIHLENASMVECSMAGAQLRGLQGRCLSLRGCSLAGADLLGAYLYRAMLTGDPPVTMNMRNCILDDAVITQAYVAADLSEASIVNAQAAYARLNQSTMAAADLRGARLFEASAVKVDFTGAQLAGVSGTLLADRCPGLVDAAADAPQHFRDALVRLDGALGAERRST